MSQPLNQSQPISRRRMLEHVSSGFGAVALAGLMSDSAYASPRELPVGAALRETHHAPKAKHVIFCYMSGGVSHVD